MAEESGEISKSESYRDSSSKMHRELQLPGKFGKGKQDSRRSVSQQFERIQHVTGTLLRHSERAQVRQIVSHTELEQSQEMLGMFEDQNMEEASARCRNQSNMVANVLGMGTDRQRDVMKAGRSANSFDSSREKTDLARSLGSTDVVADLPPDPEESKMLPAGHFETVRHGTVLREVTSQTDGKALGPAGRLNSPDRESMAPTGVLRPAGVRSGLDRESSGKTAEQTAWWPKSKKELRQGVIIPQIEGLDRREARRHRVHLLIQMERDWRRSRSGVRGSSEETGQTSGERAARMGSRRTVLTVGKGQTVGTVNSVQVEAKLGFASHYQATSHGRDERSQHSRKTDEVWTTNHESHRQVHGDGRVGARDTHVGQHALLRGHCARSSKPLKTGYGRETMLELRAGAHGTLPESFMRVIQSLNIGSNNSGDRSHRGSNPIIPLTRL
jgi:hypothetical protein